MPCSLGNIVGSSRKWNHLETRGCILPPRGIPALSKIYFLFYKLNYNWHIILYLFHVYYVVIHQLYTLQTYHHNKSSNQLASCKVNAILLMYLTSLWLTYFINRSLYFLITFTHFASSQTPSFLEIITLFSISMSLGCVCFLHSICKGNFVIFVFLTYFI